ncbi:hypothetical protein GOQ27_10105 [Clostridium sp. D2Q-11]|uniref:Alpha-L-glutamate ligase-related protein ATP-grasp domain-containing protein n=1 Tax=Anaeromonas frigoriresistens TaxID=2683708 RepID=A0A942UXW0_9FIRM|nr:hypothetical protein [Anaeromonas frigoriresistens]
MGGKIDSAITDFKYFIKDKKRKPLYKICYELIRCWIRERTIPYYYFTGFLYRKDNNRYLDHISHKTAIKLKSKLNNSKDIDILENKLIFQNYFSYCNISMPRMLAYSFNKNFFIFNKRYSVESYSYFKEVINTILQNSQIGSIFIKPLDGLGGKNTYKIKNIKEQEDQLKELYKKIETQDFLFQETVIQNEVLSKVNPSSLNTVRIHTFYNEQGEIEIMSAMMKFGIKGGIVDNASSGGFMVPVDLESGRLLAKGFTPLKLGGKEYTLHPDSRITLKGFEIPHFDKVKEFVIKAGSYIPTLRLVGWDIGITDTGPILIEGNAHFHLVNGDIVAGGLRKNKVFRTIIQKHL